MYNEISRDETVINDVHVPRFDIKQADVTPLMSSLIGTAVPTNNLGKLPALYLNVSEVYIDFLLSISRIHGLF